MAKNKAFLLIGSEDAGKTETIRGWCNLKGYELGRGFNSFVTKIKDKKELIIISSCSPQEASKYNLDKIKRLLSKRIRDYKQKTKDKGFERFIWVMAITVGKGYGKLKKEEVTEAIKLLEEKDFDLIKIHIIREKEDRGAIFTEINKFIEGLTKQPIKTKEKDQREQAEELDKIIVNSVKKG